MIVIGRVQGVFFRRAAADAAGALGLGGFARNLADGSVELVAEGPRDQLERFANWAEQGPRAARVDQVSREWTDFHGEFTRFVIR